MYLNCSQFSRVSRKVVQLFAIQAVRHSDLDLGQDIQNVQFSQRYAVDSKINLLVYNLTFKNKMNNLRSIAVHHVSVT